MTSKKVLYITYDGLTDPLGQSQILPYLVGLSKAGYKFTILSFEKRERLVNQRALINSIVTEAGIDWVPLSFTARPPLVSKFYDAIRMRQKAFSLHKEKKFDMVHCRSYIAADVGLQMKRKYGTKFFFDMRGFWADEKKDGGSWNLRNPVFKQVYRYYKKKEAAYFQNADHIISLTEAGKTEILKWDCYNPGTPIDIIPCCADMDLFTLTNAAQKGQSRDLLGIPKDKMVISYLGSLGAWYMLDEMLQLFRRVRSAYPNAFFLIVTHSSPSLVLSRLSQFGIREEDIKIVEASRKEVPVFMKASDINLSFIRPVYSKISSSPTKLGEVLSMGIPVISNSGVGDVEKIIMQINAGFIFHHFNEDEYQELLKSFPTLLQSDPGQIRNKAESVYSLTKGIDLYTKSYQSVFS